MIIKERSDYYNGYKERSGGRDRVGLAEDVQPPRAADAHLRGRARDQRRGSPGPLQLLRGIRL